METISDATKAMAITADIRRPILVVIVITWPVSFIVWRGFARDSGGVRPYASGHRTRFYRVSALVQTSPGPLRTAFWRPVSFVSRPPRRERSAQVNNVVPGREEHQHHDNREPDAEPDLLGSLAERAAAQCFNRIKH